MKIKGFGNARKLHYKLGNEDFYCYIYKGNSSQNFVVTNNGDVLNNDLSGEILRSAMNYIFYNY